MNDDEALRAAAVNDDEALRAAAVNAVNVLVDGVAATMRNLEADYPKETVPMANSLSRIKLGTMKLSSYTFHNDKDSNQNIQSSF